MANVKGTVSPLIATVLLIAFSFALGAVVLSWGERFVEERAQFVNNPSEVSVGCDSIDLAPVTVDNRVIACTRPGFIRISLENHGATLSTLQGRIITASDIKVIENVLPASVASGGTSQVEVPWDGRAFEQVRLVPRTTDQARDLCPTKAVLLNSPLPSCS